MVLLEVSLGEAVDKLTILVIKLIKISDSRREDVEKELQVVKKEVKPFLPKIMHYYKQLYEINLEIWELQDQIRDMKRDNTYVDKCLKILDENDRRFRVKNKINHICNSLLKEQKGYKKKKCIFLGHFGLGDIINMVGAVRYFSTVYDEICLPVISKYTQHVNSIYEDDPSIRILSINYVNDFPYKVCRMLSNDLKQEGYDILGYDTFCTKEKCTDVGVPERFYKDLGLDPEIRKKYFYINFEKLDNYLCGLLDDNIKYAFVHEISTNKHFFNMVDPNSTDLLCINPSRNMYKYENLYLVKNKTEVVKHNFQDTFDINMIYIDDNTCDINITRTDYTDDWFMDLEIVVYDLEEKEKEIIKVGRQKNMLSYKPKIKLEKSTVPLKITRMDDKIIRHQYFIKNHLEIKEYKYPDKFDIKCIYVDNNTIDICTRRIDKQENWGLDLEFYLYSLDGKEKELIKIGKSNKIVNYKTTIEVSPYEEHKNTEKYKELAELFVNKYFFNYINLIKNANELHLIDSSFSCITPYLELKANKKVLYLRNYNDKYSTFDFSWEYDYSNTYKN